MPLLSFSYFLPTTSLQETKNLSPESHEDDVSPTSWEVVHSLSPGPKELYSLRHVESLDEDETVMVDSIRSIDQSTESVITAEDGMEGSFAQTKPTEKNNEVRSLRYQVSVEGNMQGGFKLDAEMLKNVENYKVQVSQLSDKITAKDRLLKDSREREEELLRRISARDTEVADLTKYRDFAMQRIEDLQSQLRSLASELKGSKESSDQIRRPLFRNSDPKVQTSLWTTNSEPDSISGAEVVERIRALNSEILHTAIFIASAFLRYKPLASNCIIDARGRMTGILGNKMVQLLVTTRGECDLMILQIAIQAVLVELSRRTIESWSLGDASMDQTFRDIYTTMQDAESQSVFGRWRALTRFYLQRALQMDQSSEPTHPSTSSHLIPECTSLLADILVATGRMLHHSQAVEFVQDQYSENLTNIDKLAIQLNKSIGSSTTSADLCPMSIQPNDRFDPEWMEDTHGRDLPQGTKRGGMVLGTTDLGLARWEKSINGQFDRSLLLKPKVALHSVIKDSQAQ